MIISCFANEDAEALELTWESGAISELPAEYLRKEAMDAWSRRERIDHGEVKVAPGIRITGCYPIGAQGVNLHFSDGHDKAIYPYPYLRELSDANDK